MQLTPNASNLAFVEELYELWLAEPQSVSQDWRAYFESFPAGVRPARIRPSFRPASIFDPLGGSAATGRDSSGAGQGNGNEAAALGGRASGAARAAVAGPAPERVFGRPSPGAAPVDGDAALLREKVDRLVRSFRERGHLLARIDPLGRPRPPVDELEPAFHGIGASDLERSIPISPGPGAPAGTVRAILAGLQDTYCRSIGVQYMHVDDARRRSWLQERIESGEDRAALPADEQARILARLTDAVTFEEFVQKRFLGAKSFSLEGSESLVPLLDAAIETAGAHGVNDVVIGMAHRGRLNVLANVLGKKPRQIFREFADVDPALYRMRGDVKYHLGHSSEHTTSGGARVRLALCFNPSHLEFVNPVAQGRVRARQDRAADVGRANALALLVHGDAAFAGQGINQETLNLAGLAGYAVGGSIHVIVNNQIGFTTDPRDARSTTYCTAVAEMLPIPIFHVNGEDPEAVVRVVRLALDYRRAWKSDVVIDLYGYRRRGHNEGDEPGFTQPLMYAAIRERPSVREVYLQQLLASRRMTRAQADGIAEASRRRLETELDLARSQEYAYESSDLGPAWKDYAGGPDTDAPEVETQVAAPRLAELLIATTKVPDGFSVHPKLERILEQRAEMARGAKPLDWAAGEALAFATLAAEGRRVRVSGQDVERGTFSHRHAKIHDVENGATWTPLANLAPGQGPVEFHNSPLSELAVLGFEYGYTLDCPDGLVVWEAQFGDFNNGAQVVIDQFLVSGEEKWKRLSGLTLLLPHGYEGQGPEHSSARLERFLQMCAGDNIQVANLTTPASLFHCLRRQVARPWRKPLVILSPKSLLRHPKATSPLADLANGRFERILADVPRPGVKARGEAERVILCSGKIYYELESEREKKDRHYVAILRAEQLYPLADEAFAAALAPHGARTPVVWVQEEPENMGAWRHFSARFGATLLGRPFQGVSRPAAASPATGSPSSHKLEQQEVLDRAFARL